MELKTDSVPHLSGQAFPRFVPFQAFPRALVNIPSAAIWQVSLLPRKEALRQ